jgi:hypothetical protein
MDMNTEPNMGAGPYRPSAIYSFDADCVEYLKGDVFCFYERIDSRLTLIKDATGNTLIGFKIKGFRNTFERLKIDHDLSDRQFVSMMAAIVAIYSEIGDQLTADPKIKAAYQAAYQLASNDNVKLESYGFALAA